MAAKNQTLSIANGGTDSAVVEALPLAPAVSVLIMAPATLPETVTVQVAEKPTGTFVDLQTNGSDVVLTAAKATQITVMGGACWRLHAGSAVAAARDFRVIVNRIGEPFLP
jgi:hypothetical protein